MPFLCAVQFVRVLQKLLEERAARVAELAREKQAKDRELSRKSVLAPHSLSTHSIHTNNTIYRHESIKVCSEFYAQTRNTQIDSIPNQFWLRVHE